MSRNNSISTDTSDARMQGSCKGAGEAPPKPKYPSIGYFELFRYATILDKFNIFVATIMCMFAAIFNTVLSFTFGEMTGSILEYVERTNNSLNQTDLELAAVDLMDGVNSFVISSCSLGIGMFICTYAATVIYNYSALRQVFKIRELFLSKILNQDIAWYDINQTGDFASRIADDLKKIEEGIGEKVATFLFYQFTFTASVVQSLILGWELALICMVSFPITTISMGVVAWVSSKFSKQEMEAYGSAGAIADEALSAIRTVLAFGGQEKEQDMYNKKLLQARSNNIKRSFFNALSSALMWLFSYASFALSFWYGVKLIIRERELPPEMVTYDPATMIAVFFSVMTATWYFGMSSPFIETFGIAKGAAIKIFAIINSQPLINASKNTGLMPDEMNGKIVFKDVCFQYPSRPDVTVLHGLNLTINPGETVALVGSSGCGKSTCIQLIQRYYDPKCGNITIDGYDVKDLNLTWLRNNIGVVGQEPVLFETTISNNISLGRLNANQDDIEKAAKKANAHNFIMSLPQGYETMVGERGSQLSGGQKQRIAIARALVREPTILLLDEATSALDTSSEAIVQAALDAASNECTTVIVAHRLSTVRKANRIVVIANGTVKEEGTHDELILKKGAYYDLVMTQLTEDYEENTPDLIARGQPEMLHQNSHESTNRKSLPRNPFYNKETDADVAKPTSSSLWPVMKFNSPEWWIILIGCLGAFVNGAGIPIYSVVFGNVVSVLASDDDDYLRSMVNKYSLFFIYIGVGTALATLLQIYMLGIAGEKLTMRLRSKMFKAFLSQEIGWFDNKDNGVGALCARLSGEAANVQGATGQRIGTILNAIATIILSLIVCFFFDWRLSLVSLCFVPLNLYSIYLESKMVTKDNLGHNASLQKSTKIAVEGISNIRTVTSLNCERVFQDMYMSELIPYQRAAKKNTHIRGIVYGLSRSIVFFAYAAALAYGSILIRDGNVEYTAVFIVSEALITGAWALGNAFAFTPNFQKGLISANRIFDLLNRVPKIQNGSKDINERWEKGNINYENVYFAYPTRSTATVLKGLDLSIMQGKMVALVGPSGCGKSTIVQLLERFYDPFYGKVKSDGGEIKDMHLSALRSHLGIVSQEPNLFSRTIADNIAYGDTSRTVSREEIVEAAKQANIHNFVSHLPLGYDTKLGEKGTQLSGGQKQRVAIARALVRNPKVLLLDEATSALDAESEKVVQEALDKAKMGRTCISIAHRLSTIQDADVICVINQGRVAEIGTHSYLIGLGGIYSNLYRLQSNSL